MKKLLLCLLCALSAACTWAQTRNTQDFAAHFMRDNSDNDEVKCVTVGPKMISSLLSENYGCNENMKEWMKGVKSLRIVTSESNVAKLRSEAIELLKANSTRYSEYRDKNNTDYGDCLWVRNVKGKTVELVYVAPLSEKGFMVMNFTGKINDAFIRNIVSPGES